jgi:hypothetical protein
MRYFSCPHCGAVYEVKVRSDSKSDYRNAVCSYCGDVMGEWRGKARHYRRTGRAPDKMQLVDSIVTGARQAAAAKAHRRSGAARRRRPPTSKARANLVSRFRSSHTLAATSDANFGIKGTLTTL